MSFIFILNLVSFEGELPCKLTDKYTLRRAKLSEVKRIQKRLNELKPMVGSSPPYDRDFEGGNVSTKLYAKDKWLYWILDCPSHDIDFFKVAKALALLKQELYVGFAIVESDSLIKQSSSLFQYLGDFKRVGECNPVTIPTTSLSKVESYFTLIDAAAVKQSPAHFALKQFIELRSLPPRSNHQILGCFAVIESLITHEPKDSGPSLTHQVKRKLPLLENFFERALDFGPFGTTAKETVWKKFYDLRSDIAHGTRFEFDQKYAALKSRETALEFLREITKLVILVALEKPDLIKDLQAV